MPRWRWPWSESSATPRGRLVRWLLVGVAVLLVLVLIGRLAAPSIVEKVVEKNLEDMPGGYRGTVDHIEMRMLDAEIALVGLQIEKKNGLVPVPFMKVRELVLGTVRDGMKPRTTLRFVAPDVSYVDAEREAKKQTGPNIDLAEIREQLPFELKTVEIEDGTVHFRNFEAKPDVDVYLAGLSLTWDELVGCMPPGNASCRSRLKGEGTLMKSGRMSMHGRFARMPEVKFDAKMAVRGLRAEQLNSMLEEYAKVDVKKGDVDIDATYERRGEKQNVLIVPGLEDFEVIGSDDKDTRFFREVGLAAVAGYFERKRGKKAIAISSRKKGESKFELVDIDKGEKDSKKE